MLTLRASAWDKFNARTQMMKGLFNYEQAYRRYTRLCLQEFVDDKIQYAEIRPNFMETNQLWANDGTRQINNAGIVELIIEEYDRFQSDNRGVFGGLKIIYCTPRSSSREAVRYSLDECLAFKKRWPQWIAGYDILGEESKGQPLKAFIPEFLDFKRKCAEANLDIPFLFHCGETLEMGGDTDGNLVDAVLLGARRIGHGFALPRHPYVLEQMKKHRVCVELCPISNEILGLTPRIGGHAMYSLLARNVPCTLSTDNGTLFRYVEDRKRTLFSLETDNRRPLYLDPVSRMTSTRLLLAGRTRPSTAGGSSSSGASSTLAWSRRCGGTSMLSGSDAGMSSVGGLSRNMGISSRGSNGGDRLSRRFIMTQPVIGLVATFVLSPLKPCRHHVSREAYSNSCPEKCL